MLSKSNRERMNNLGIILDANDQIVAGGKTFDPMNTEASQLIEALGLPSPPNATDKSSVKAQEAMQRNVQAVLEEIREKLGAKQKLPHGVDQRVGHDERRGREVVGLH